MKMNACLSSLVALALGVVSAQAQWTYYDVMSSSNGVANTFGTVSGLDDWSGGVDGATPVGWRFRNTGPGAPSWNASAFTGMYANGDPALYTLIAGLIPNQSYAVRVYGVYPKSATNAVVSTRSRFGAEFSLDTGTTWSLIDTKGAGLINWVDNSSGVGNPMSVPLNGDTRFFTELPMTLVADGTGVARIDVRLPQLLSDLSAQDKFNLDGYALAIPEPATAGLAGLAAAALLILRRRR
jgi:hypothetical protein